MKKLILLLALSTVLIAGEHKPQSFKMTTTVVYDGVTLEQAVRIEKAIKSLVADTAKVEIKLEEFESTMHFISVNAESLNYFEKLTPHTYKWEDYSDFEGTIIY